MKKYLPVIGILLLGLAVRLYYISDISLWHDEAFSAFLIQYPWGEMMHRIALDVHPPLYYVLLRIWDLGFGNSIWSLRGFSVLFEVGAIWLVWLLVKTAFKDTLGQRAALWAALLVALNPFQIKYMGEARMYSLGVFFSLLAAYLLVKALHFHTRLYESERKNMPNLPENLRNRRVMWLSYLAFSVCCGIMMLTHYYLLFTVAALCLYGLLYVVFHFRSSFKRYIPLLLSFIVIVSSFLPWLNVFLRQYRQVQEVYWIDKMTVWSIPSTLWAMFIGLAHDVNRSATQKILVLITLVAVFSIYRFLRKTETWEKWLVVFCSVAPFVGAILFVVLARMKGSTSSVFLERYFLYSSSFFLILLTVWLSNLKTKWLSRGLLIGYSLLTAVVLSYNLSLLKVPEKPGMNGAAKFLEANVEPGQKVFVGLPWEFFNFKYYTQKYYQLPVRPLLFSNGTGHARDMSHFAGNALLEDADLVPNLGLGAKSGDTVWLLWTYAFRSSKPDVPPSWVRVDEKEYPEVLPYIGASLYITQYKVN